MIVSLPMYDTPATRSANDRLWQNIRQNLKRGPKSLDRSGDPEALWSHPDLLLSQTCGMPYRLQLHGHVRLVATPDYDVSQCPPGYYKSHLVVRVAEARSSLADFRSATLARNSALSQSGWAALLSTFKDAGISPEGHVIDTGSHRDSIRSVASGMADIAAIDAITWALLARDTSDTVGVRILCSTLPTPGLPLITSASENPQEIRAAVNHAIETLPARDRERLLIKGLVHISHDTYLENVHAAMTPSP